MHPVTEGRNLPSVVAVNFEGQSSAPGSPAWSPLADQEEVALGMYYHSYCVSGSTISTAAHLQAQANGCLWSAIQVLGNIEINRRWLLQDSSAAVTEAYTRSLAQLNAALADPRYVRDDSVLLATLILSSVEARTAPSRLANYWEAHTAGAAALLQLRGGEQVTTRIGAALYLQVTAMLTISCIMRRQAIPDTLLTLRFETRQHLADADSPVWTMQGALYRFVNFQAKSIPAASGSHPSLVQTALADTLSIQEELNNVFHQAGPVWRFDHAPPSMFQDVLPYEHVYHSIMSTQLWNAYRTATIKLSAIIADLCHALPDRPVLEQQPHSLHAQALQTINAQALHSIAAVPRLRKLIEMPAAHHASPAPEEGDICYLREAPYPSAFKELRPDPQPLPYMHGCLMQWSVYFAAECVYVETRLRRTLVEILSVAAGTMRIEQWRVLAESLRPLLMVE